MISEQNDEECDATKADSSNAAGFIKKDKLIITALSEKEDCTKYNYKNSIYK